MVGLGIIVAGTHLGRVGLPIGQWIEERAREYAGFDTVEVLDLAEIGLPHTDELHHPRLGDYIHQHTKDCWSATIARTDALVFVTPEYSHGCNAALKNAIDYLFNEWAYKAVGLVSYGGVAAGTRAAQVAISGETAQVERLNPLGEVASASRHSGKRSAAPLTASRTPSGRRWPTAAGR